MLFKTKRHIIILLTGIFMTTTFLYALQNKSVENFNETEWEEITSSHDPALFYAPHEKDGKFFNPWIARPNYGFLTMLKWRFTGKKGEYTEEEKNFLPNVKNLTAEYINTNDNFFTWLGHVSILMKISGRVILIDPILGDIPYVRKRWTPSALCYEEAGLIKGDILVLLTHNHYDHLDRKSLDSLPKSKNFVVAKGLSPIIKDIPKNSIAELDWWEEIHIDNIKIVFLPSQHWSRRMMFDTNESLWGSYLIDTGKKKIFICGDTGYSNIYREIASKYPKIEYAFMSTGATQPRWFMRHSHQNEIEAIRGFNELKAKYMIPIHWGAFVLGDEPVGCPAVRMKKNFPGAMIMDCGEIINF